MRGGARWAFRVLSWEKKKVEVEGVVEGCPLLVEASTPAGMWHTAKVRKPRRKRMGN